jgi:hypothetical protein
VSRGCRHEHRDGDGQGKVGSWENFYVGEGEEGRGKKGGVAVE